MPDLLLGMDVSEYVILAIMMAVIFLMGMFIDWAAILLVVVPIFTPIALDLNFNPLWFAMLVCINLQTSFLTPPFGYALFYFKGVAPPEYTMGDIYRGIIPFVALAGHRPGPDDRFSGDHHLAARCFLRTINVA